MQSKNFKFLMKVIQIVFQLSFGWNRVGERACSTPTTRNSFGLQPRSYCERNTHKS